jgi:hypothetical protein
MKPSHTIGGLSLVAVLGSAAFVVGRFAAGTPESAPAPTAATTTTAAEDGAEGRSTAAASAQALADLTRLAAVEEPEPDIAVNPAPPEETPKAAAERRTEMSAWLTKALGGISEEQRRLFLDLNDRALEFQRRSSSELLDGTITHEEYMQATHEEVMNQLAEIHGFVTDAQYRILTGLEPGVDPFEFMKTGVGGAPGHIDEEESVQ